MNTKRVLNRILTISFVLAIIFVSALLVIPQSGDMTYAGNVEPETWVFNEGAEIPAYPQIDVSGISFKDANNNAYTSMKYEVGEGLYYDTTLVWQSGGSGTWQDEAYKTITFDSPLDTNSALYSWMNNRAKKVYNIVYDLNEGSGTEPTDTNNYSCSDNVTLNDGSGLTKEGYVFRGWNTDSTATSGSTGLYTIQESDLPQSGSVITFYAVWKTPYSVTYDKNAGSDEVTNLPTDSTLYVEGDNVTISSDTPTRTGYKFLGWNTDKDAKAALSFTNNQFEMGNDNVILYAIWEEKGTISISTDSQYIDVNEAKTPYTITGDDKDAGNFVIKYYYTKDSVLGWYIEAPTAYGKYKIQITREEDDNYKAYDSGEITDGYIVGFTVKFDINGGTGTTPSSQFFISESEVVTYPQNTNEEDFSRDGYKFVGWIDYYSSGETRLASVDETSLASPRTLYACWEPLICALTSTDYEVQTIKSGIDLTYKWYKNYVEKALSSIEETKVLYNEGLGGYDDQSKTISSTLYQNIRFAEVTISDVPGSSAKLKFKINGGSGEKYKNYGTGETLVEDSEGYYTIISDVKDGSVSFAVLANNSSNFFTISDVTLYSAEPISNETSAKLGDYTDKESVYCELTYVNSAGAKTYTYKFYTEEATPKSISFDGNNETSGTAPETIYQLTGRNVTITKGTLLKTGCNLIGWNTNKSATSALSFNNNEYEVGNDDVTMYAIWEVVPHVHGTVGEADYICYDKILNYDFDYETSNVLTEGNYYLVDDFHVSDRIYISKDSNVNICLNGFNIVIEGVMGTSNTYGDFWIQDNVTLNITDCKHDEATHGAIVNEDAQDGEYYYAHNVFNNYNSVTGSSLTLSNLDIELAYDYLFTGVYSNTVTSNFTIDNCSITTDAMNLMYISAYQGQNNFTFKDSTITSTRVEPDYNYYNLISDYSTSSHSTYNIVNTKINSNSIQFLYANYADINVDKDSVLTFNGLNPIIECRNNSVLNLKGTLINTYTPTEEEKLEYFDSLALVNLDLSTVNLYSDAKLSGKSGLDFYLECDPDEGVSKIVIKEELKNKTPLSILYADGDVCCSGEAIDDFYKFHEDEDVYDYFSLYVPSVLSSVPFFEKEDGEDIINVTLLEFTKNLDDTNDTVETNNPNATYSWYKINVKENKVTSDDIDLTTLDGATFEDGIFTTTKNYFEVLYTNSNISSAVKIGAYSLAQEVIFEESSDDFTFISLTSDQYKAKAYYKFGDGDWILIDDSYVSTYESSNDKSFGTYENGYWTSSGMEVVPGLSYEGFYFVFDTTSVGSPYSDINGITKYQIKLVFDEGEPLAVYGESYVNAFIEYGFEIRKGLSFYIAYTTNEVDKKIDNATGKKLPSGLLPGYYLCKASLNGGSITSGIFTIDLFDITLDSTKEECTYDGKKHAYELKGEDKDVGSYKVEYYVDSNWTETAPINAGSYDVRITREEDSVYKAYSNVIDDGLVIKKASATINTDSVIKTYTYTGEEQVVNSGATLNHDETTLVYTNNKFTDVGTGIYTIKVTSAETANYLSAEVSFDITVNKKDFDMSGVSWDYKNAFTYDGKEKEVKLIGLPNGLSIKEYKDNKKTEAGSYTAKAIFDYDAANYNEPTVDDLSWKINNSKLVYKEKTQEQVIVETEEGFIDNVTLEVEVTVEVEVESKELTVDYYNLPEEEIKLSDDERVGVVFEVKLIQTVNGVSKEIQPSDIKEGTVIKVKMRIPDSVDISKITRLLHVHSKDDIEVIEFDKSKVTKDRYYELEITKLSEFAFIYKTEETIVVKPIEDKKETTETTETTETVTTSSEDKTKESDVTPSEDEEEVKDSEKEEDKEEDKEVVTPTDDEEEDGSGRKINWLLIILIIVTIIIIVVIRKKVINKNK